MDEDDPVALALLVVGRGDEEAHVEADGDQNHRDPLEPGDHAPRQGIKAGRGGEFEPVDQARTHVRLPEAI